MGGRKEGKPYIEEVREGKKEGKENGREEGRERKEERKNLMREGRKHCLIPISHGA